MTLAQIFKAVTNQRPEPWKEREATDELIQQLSDRVRELMQREAAQAAEIAQLLKERNALMHTAPVLPSLTDEDIEAEWVLTPQTGGMDYLFFARRIIGLLQKGAK